MPQPTSSQALLPTQFHKTEKLIYSILQTANDMGASDIFLSAETTPSARIHGEIVFLDQFQPFTSQELSLHLREAVSTGEFEQFEEYMEMDYSHEEKDIGRFRVNAFVQIEGVSIVFRKIMTHIPDFKELNLPPQLERIANLKQGLVLMAGSMGVGKAAYFDGVTGNYLTVTNDPVFDSDEFTISLMAKSDSETWSHYGFLAGRRPSFIVHPLIGSKRMEFFAIDNLNNSHLVICEVNDITNWNHYMMSVKNGTLRGWLNGELCQEFTLPANTTIQDSTAPLWIGRDSYIPDRILDGWIDNVRFFSVGIDKIQ